MIDSWISIDGVPEAELPEWAQGEGRRRVVLGEEGLALVEGGEGSVARWSDVMGVAEADGDAYVMLARRPPAPPWFRVSEEMLSGELAAGGISGFAKVVRARRSQGGYRDAVSREATMSAPELERAIRQRQAIPGAVEVPTRLLLAPWSMAKGFVAVGSLSLCLFVPAFLLPLAGSMTRSGVTADFAMFLMYGGVALGLALAIWAMRRGWAFLDRRYYRETPAPRMLVLAPAGCMVAFEGGARAFDWTEVGAFRAEGDADQQAKAGNTFLVVEGPEGRHGVIDGAWFGAPLPLIVAVAEAYRARVQR